MQAVRPRGTELRKLEVLLGELLSSASGDDVLAFLDERASVGAQLSVARAMPEWLDAMLLMPGRELRASYG